MDSGHNQKTGIYKPTSEMNRTFKIKRIRLGPGAFIDHADLYSDEIDNQYIRDYQERMHDTHDQLEHTQDIPKWDSRPVQDALSKLSAQDRHVLTLYYMSGKTQLQVARIYGTSQANVCRRLESATARLEFWARLPAFPGPEVWTVMFNRTVWAFVDEYQKDYVQKAAARRLTRRLRKPVTQCRVCLTLHDTLRLLKDAPESLNRNAMHTWLSYALINGPYVTPAK